MNELSISIRKRRGRTFALRFRAVLGSIAISLALTMAESARAADDYDFHDVHFHLTNYVQKGPPITAFLDTMGTKVGRVALFVRGGTQLLGPRQIDYFLDVGVRYLFRLQ